MNERIADFAERLASGFRALEERIPLILGDPKAYPREAMLLATALTLSVVLGVLLVLVGVEVVTALRRRQRLKARRRVRWDLPGWTLAALMLLGVIATLAPNTLAVSRLCGSCHETREAATSWAQGVHGEVTCYGCHAPEGIVGSAEAGIRGIARAISRPARETLAVPRSVYSGRCLGCHDGVSRGVVTNGDVRMRHSDVIAAGYDCMACHVSAGHQRTAAQIGVYDRPPMDHCLACHDGVRAPASCETCHDRRPSDAHGSVPEGSNLVEVTCSGCHTEDTEDRCVDCHGLVLPHPESFFGEHAGRSWADPALCARCHEQASEGDGCGCHADVNVHGTYAEWFPKHGAQALEVWPGGCNCHPVDSCERCHDALRF